MHDRMNWGGHPHKCCSGTGMDMEVPLIPAPVAVLTMIVGVAIGVIIGHKKAMMHGMGGHGMMGGMGHGMMGGGNWMARKKAMMYGAPMHHHHGYGTRPCCCGAEGDQTAEASEGTEEGGSAEA